MLEVAPQSALIAWPTRCAECNADLAHSQRPIVDIKTGLGFDRYDCHINYFQRPIMEKNLKAGVAPPPKETEKL